MSKKSKLLEVFESTKKRDEEMYLKRLENLKKSISVQDVERIKIELNNKNS